MLLTPLERHLTVGSSDFPPVMSIPTEGIFVIEGSYAYTCRIGLRPAFCCVEVESYFAWLAPGGMAERIVLWRSLTYPDIRIRSTHRLTPFSYQICLTSGVGRGRIFHKF